MSVTVHIAYVLWLLLGAVAFYKLPPRKAVLATFISGWLFLPNAGYDILALHSKPNIVSAGVLVWSAIFHSQLWLRLRLRLIDVPMLVWCCFCPLASSITNDLGNYDAVSALVYSVLLWGVPYLVGRLYFGSIEGLRELAIGVLMAGIVYVPFCLWEIRMSPHLHEHLYGFRQHDFAQTYRFGGWRPMVFKQHGLAVALGMGTATLLALWMWGSGTLKKLWGVPSGLIALVLCVTTVLCKSVNAIVLVIFGSIVYVLNKSLKTALPIVFLALLPPLYMYLRITGSFSGEALVTLTGQTINEDRAQSIEFRLVNEKLLLDQAFKKKLLGWSRWGGSRIRDKAGRDLAITDSVWIIVFGVNGIVGLIALTAFQLLPVFVLLLRCPAKYWPHPKIAPAGALAVVLVLDMVDDMFNSMYDPLFFIAAGALMGLTKHSVVAALKPSILAAQRRLLPASAPQVVTARTPGF